MMVSCRDFPFSSYTRGNSLARVGDAELFYDEVRPIFTPGLSPDDSVKLLNSYVDSWVKKQLKIDIAESLFVQNAADIEKMVDEYRNSLLIYKFENEYVNDKVDTTISRREVEEYYMKNRNDFVLSSSLIRAIMVKFPVGSRHESKLRELAHTAKADNLQDLIDLAVKNDIEYREYPAWTDYVEVVSFMPRLSDDVYRQIRTKTGFYEVTDGGYKYFLTVTDLLPEGGIMPLDMTINTIRTIIFNKRKTDALRTLEDSLYRQAVGSGSAVLNLEAENPES